jgi:hypothetical protein
MPRLRLPLLVAALVIVAGWLLTRERAAVQPPATSPAMATGPRAAGAPAIAPIAPAAPAAPIGPPRHVTTVASAEARAELVAAIARAQAARAAARADRPRPGDAPPPGDGDEGEVEAALPITIRAAMREVIPTLADCYTQAQPTLKVAAVDIAAHLTLRGDSDVGTLIDTSQLTDATGAPLPAGFDDCLRTTFMRLELPPLAEGATVEVTYPFAFRTDPEGHPRDRDTPRAVPRRRLPAGAAAVTTRT